MTHPASIALMEHLTMRSDLSLQVFCARFRAVLGLPELFDAENETEWGCVEVSGVEYNVSKPYEAATLNEWDPTVPDGCNFGVSLILFRNHSHPTHEWAYDHLVIPAASKIAEEFSTEVYYHRTWIESGENIVRRVLFKPGGEFHTL